MNISVIIPVYNDEKNLINCVKSLQKQSIKESFEIIVVEDGSISKLKKELKEFNNVRYFWKENGGPASARNLGIKKSKGEYTAFIDSDCIADKGWLKYLYNKIKGSKEIGGVGGRILNYNKDYISNNFHLIEFGEFIDKYEKFVRIIPSCNSVYFKTDLLKINLFDESLHYGEDVDLNWRIIKCNKKIIYSPRALVLHKTSSNIKDIRLKMFLMGQGVYNTRRKHKDIPHSWITKRYLLWPLILFMPFLSLVIFLKRNLNLYLILNPFSLIFLLISYGYFWLGVLLQGWKNAE